MPIMNNHGFDSTDDEEDLVPLPRGPGGPQELLLPTHHAPPLKVDFVDLEAMVSCPPPGALALSELPGCRFRTVTRNLAEDIKTLQEFGITDVVCLIINAEFQKYKVSKLFQVR